MEIKNKLTVTRGEGGEAQGEKEGEGSSERTCIKGRGGLHVRGGVGTAGENDGRKLGTAVIE